MSETGDYPGHPPALWKDLFKIDLWKTMQRMVSMRRDFARFPRHLPIGHEAPDFSLRDAAGVTRSLHDLRGKVVVLEFGAIT